MIKEKIVAFIKGENLIFNNEIIEKLIEEYGDKYINYKGKDTYEKYHNSISYIKDTITNTNYKEDNDNMVFNVDDVKKLVIISHPFALRMINMSRKANKDIYVNYQNHKYLVFKNEKNYECV